MPASSFVCMRALESDGGGMPAGSPRSRAVEACLSGRHGIRLDQGAHAEGFAKGEKTPHSAAG